MKIICSGIMFIPTTGAHQFLAAYLMDLLKEKFGILLTVKREQTELR